MEKEREAELLEVQERTKKEREQQAELLQLRNRIESDPATRVTTTPSAD